MTSYRTKRRAFLAGLGGAFGLHALLSGMEASAQGTPPPPRLLVMHWPLGTVQQRFLPVPAGVDDGFTVSPILQPFEDFGLHDDMTVLFGLRHDMRGQGGGNEDGTVFAVTGANSPGTRDNGGEPDDGVAGGPSFDQIFLRRVANLQTPLGSVNACSDARVWSYELSTRCLSYSYETREVMSMRPGGPITEHVPLMGELEPLVLYNRLFSNMAPGGEPDAALRALLLRKSVLDYALDELARLRTLAPAAEREKLDVHAEAIRGLERELQVQIDDRSPGTCTPPRAPASGLAGLQADTGSIVLGEVDREDATSVAAVGMAHAAVIRAAFQCDLVRVATLQWVPSTNQVAIAGVNPEKPEAAYQIGSVHYAVQDHAFYAGPTPATNAWVYEAMTNIYTWFSRLTAEVVSGLKSATDIFGGSVLDSTIVPYITEEADPTDRRSPLPAVLLGGRALGLRGGKFLNFSSSGPRSHNDLWMTVAQALLATSDPVGVLADEKFLKTNVAPIAGLWSPA